MTCATDQRARVKKAHHHVPSVSGRRGTVEASLAEFADLFGPPQAHAPDGLDVGAKVTTVWTFRTPRGYANVRDYWWNEARELSIDADNARSALWLRGWLRRQGVRAYPGPIGAWSGHRGWRP